MNWWKSNHFKLFSTTWQDHEKKQASMMCSLILTSVMPLCHCSFFEFLNFTIQDQKNPWKVLWTSIQVSVGTLVWFYFSSLFVCFSLSFHTLDMHQSCSLPAEILLFLLHTRLFPAFLCCPDHIADKPWPDFSSQPAHGHLAWHATSLDLSPFPRIISLQIDTGRPFPTAKYRPTKE